MPHSQCYKIISLKPLIAIKQKLKTKSSSTSHLLQTPTTLLLSICKISMVDNIPQRGEKQHSI